jgi:peptidoglycan hydrolase-like protein with peptidoglycan-binding domain
MPNRKRATVLTVIAVLLFITLTAPHAFAYSEGTLLRRDMSNDNVTRLQQDLHSLGFLEVTPTGFYGSMTESAVKDFQRHAGLTPDGLAGSKTISELIRLTQSPEKMAEVVVTRGSADRTKPVGDESIQMLPWFGHVDSLFARGDVATIIDVETGLSYQIKRTYGTNHADVEGLTKEDTAVMKQTAGGEWNWTRRPVIVEVNGVRIAASMALMPHAGRDDLPALQTVNSRSGGYGRGTNLDGVKGNDMHGHVDLHFLGSKGHASGRVDSKHQAAVKEAHQSGL